MSPSLDPAGWREATGLAGRIQERLKLAILHGLVPLDAIARIARRKAPSILVDQDGAVPPGAAQRLCLFAHFDRDDVIDDYVLHYLKAIHDLGCETVFVSTAEGLDQTQLAKIVPFTRRILVRRNVGHDFGSWKIGLQSVGDLQNYRELVIANDSVYGPFRDLNGLFARMEHADVDFWGATDSWRYVPHLQSYFLVFREAALRSEAFATFWNRLPFHRYKHVVILRGEIALTRRLARAGLRYAALCPYEALRARQSQEVREAERRHYRGQAANPVRSLWGPLIQDHDFPFLKVELPRDNPLEDPSVADWERWVGACSSYDTGLISRHLARVAGPRPAHS